VEVSIREHLRPRTWYVVALFCGSTFSDPINFKLHMYNYNLGWQNELSMAQVNVVYCYIAAFVLMIALMYTINRITVGGFSKFDFLFLPFT